MQVRTVQSNIEHFSDRPTGIAVDTVIIHSLYAKDSGEKRFDPATCIEILRQEKVSCHYMIDRDGGIWGIVPETKKAWHAGISKMPSDGREGVNDFSIGIELIGDEVSGFTDAQYGSLQSLTADLRARHPIKFVLGHEHIAPGRKSDPGVTFDWGRFLSSVAPGIEGPDIQ